MYSRIVLCSYRWSRQCERYRPPKLQGDRNCSQNLICVGWGIAIGCKRGFSQRITISHGADDNHQSIGGRRGPPRCLYRSLRCAEEASFSTYDQWNSILISLRIKNYQVQTQETLLMNQYTPQLYYIGYREQINLSVDFSYRKLYSSIFRMSSTQVGDLIAPINISEQIHSSLVASPVAANTADQAHTLLDDGVLSNNARSSSQSHTAAFAELAPQDFADDVIISVVSLNLEQMFNATLQNEEFEEKAEEFSLGLTSVLSDQQIAQPPQTAPKQADQNKQASVLEEVKQESTVPVTIDLSNGSFQQSLLKKTSSNANTYEYILKNDGLSVESTLNTFELFAVENQFQILGTSTTENTIRKKGKATSLQSIFCCLTSKAVQVYNFKQNASNPHIFVLNMIEGSKEQFTKFSKTLRRKLWEMDELILSQEESLKLFLDINKATTIKQLKDELKDHQNKRKSEEYVMEFSVDRVMETIDTLIDSFSKKSASATTSPAQIDVISKFVFVQSGILEIFQKIFKSSEDILKHKRKKITGSLNFPQVFEKLNTDDKLCLFQKDKVSKQTPFPYKSAIDQLQRLNTLVLPVQQLQCLASFFEKVKDCYLNFHQSDIIIENSYYILPVYVFSVVYANIDHFYSKVKLLEWYIKRNDQHEGAGQILKNLCSAVDYINNKWT